MRGQVLDRLSRHGPRTARPCGRHVFRLVLGAVLLSGPGSAAAATAGPPPSPGPQPGEPLAPVSPVGGLDPARVALGERLFGDVRLSDGDKQSCATCHPLDQGAMDGRPRGLALDGRARLRNTPTLFNVALNASFNWDGATNTLEAHADKLLSNPDVMNAHWPELLARLRADPGYRASFQATYPDGLSRVNLVDALATFERTLVTPDSRFDRYLRGNTPALTSEEVEGYRLFKSYGCVACHQGVNVGGNLFQKFGVFQEFVTTSASGNDIDSGRYAVTRVERDRGFFRVPSLRNVALTAPYFHDGSMPTLEGAVATMARVQLGRSLTQDDIRLIVSFLQSLTGEFRGQSITIAGSGRR